MKSRGMVIGLVSMVVAASAVGFRAYAGYKSPGNDVTIGPGYFYGTFARVRSTADASQYIGCTTQKYASSTVVSCYANTIGGSYANCTMSGPANWDGVAAIGPNTHLDVSFSGGTCTRIGVYNSSFQPITLP